MYLLLKFRKIKVEFSSQVKGEIQQWISNFVASNKTKIDKFFRKIKAESYKKIRDELFYKFKRFLQMSRVYKVQRFIISYDQNNSSINLQL